MLHFIKEENKKGTNVMSNSIPYSQDLDEGRAVPGKYEILIW